VHKKHLTRHSTISDRQAAICSVSKQFKSVVRELDTGQDAEIYKTFHLHQPITGAPSTTTPSPTCAKHSIRVKCLTGNRSTAIALNIK